MKIKENKEIGFYLRVINKIKQVKLVFALGVVLIYSFLVFMLGGVAHKQGVFGEVLVPAIQQNVKIPFNYLKGLMSEPERLIIDIKHKDYQKLAFKRKNALRDGVLHPFPEDYVNAKIRWNGRTEKVKLRLKGDLSDHWARDYKWSLRVKAKGEGTVLGMRNFSLQHPRTRGFFNDWVLHEILKKEGLIALRYDFVDVVVNGRQLGIYAIEEHFEQKLLENNQRVDGPIVRIKDHLLWYLVDPKTGFTKDKIDELYTVSPIDAFTSSRINNDPTLLNNFNTAKNLMESFRRKKLKTSDVFDADKLAKVFAVIDLFGYRHTTAYSNIRFYYNPLTSYLEPIGYDNTFIYDLAEIEGQKKQIKVSGLESDNRLNWKETFFEDKVFFEKYLKAVKEVSNKKYLDDVFNATETEFNATMNKVYKSFPAYSFEKQKTILYKNQEKIRSILDPLEGVQAYIKKIDRKSNSIKLEVGNNQFLPIIIRNVSINGDVFSLSKNETILLQSKKQFTPIVFDELNVALPENMIWRDGVQNEIKVNYSILGLSDIKQIKAFPWSHLDDDFLINDVVRKSPNVDDFDFISVSHSEKIVKIKPGKWNINKNMIIPKGYFVVCGPDTELDITGSSFILSYSPFRFNGTKDDPVRISSSDGTGQGVLILESEFKSEFKNVIFSNISDINQGGLAVKAALTLYESDSEISHVTFENNNSDVDLHVIRSNFALLGNVFERSKNISFSATYSEGHINDSIFIASGHTAVDVVGSKLEIDNIDIRGARVNGIVAKDRSILKAKKITVSDTDSAIISQDSSAVTLLEPLIRNSKTVFSVQHNKSDYGPSLIKVSNYHDSDVKGRYDVGATSTLLLGNKKYTLNTK